MAASKRRVPSLTPAEIGDAVAALERVRGLCCDTQERPMPMVIVHHCDVIGVVLHRALEDAVQNARIK